MFHIPNEVIWSCGTDLYIQNVSRLRQKQTIKKSETSLSRLTPRLSDGISDSQRLYYRFQEDPIFELAIYFNTHF